MNAPPLDDVSLAANALIRLVKQQPAHVRPWLRGVHAEATRVAFEATGLRLRQESSFARWLFDAPEQGGESGAGR